MGTRQERPGGRTQCYYPARARDCASSAIILDVFNLPTRTADSALPLAGSSTPCELDRVIVHRISVSAHMFVRSAIKASTAGVNTQRVHVQLRLRSSPTHRHGFGCVAFASSPTCNDLGDAKIAALPQILLDALSSYKALVVIKPPPSPCYS